MALKVECTTAYIGTAPVITITGADPTHSLYITWEFGSQSGTIATATKQTRFDNYIWSPYFYNEIPNATQGVGLLIVEACYGWSGSTPLVKERAVTEFTALVNVASSAPTIALPSVIDFNDTTTALTGDNSKLVRYASTALLTVRATAHHAASIAEIVVTNGDQNVADGSGGNAFYFLNVQSERFNIKVTDTRGLVTSITYTVPAERIIEYTPLTCHIGNEKPDTNGELELSCSGIYFNDVFSNLNKNTLVAYCRYKERNGTFGTWQPMTITSIANGQYTAKISITGLDYRAKYIFECRAVDEIMDVSSGEQTIVAIPVFHWSDADFVFEVPVTFKQGASGIEGGTSGDTSGGITDGKLNGDLNITGNLRLKGSGNYGNTLYFGDGSYCYLQESTDDDLTLKASDFNLNVANLYLNGGAIKAGTWTPTLATSAAVSSYTTQSGWYIRVGNVVTIGFNIGASCKSGYNTTALEISGLPFTPAANAFGGGVMFGAYVNAGFCFEAWCATTGAKITPRLQPCNNTAAGNLQIASTAYYPSGANTVTLGGTITYLIS